MAASEKDAFLCSTAQLTSNTGTDRCQLTEAQSGVRRQVLPSLGAGDPLWEMLGLEPGPFQRARLVLHHAATDDGPRLLSACAPDLTSTQPPPPQLLPSSQLLSAPPQRIQSLVFNPAASGE